MAIKGNEIIGSLRHGIDLDQFTNLEDNITKGGKAGQWSARKAQMVAKQYKAKGGGYKS